MNEKYSMKFESNILRMQVLHISPRSSELRYLGLVTALAYVLMQMVRFA